MLEFKSEPEFENALIELLQRKGWEQEVLNNFTEEKLLKNWADILYNNNRSIDRLNNYPLTDGEMAQIIAQITQLKTPIKLNTFINGKTVSITRDNPEDKEHFGKEISLKIYDRAEIAAGTSRYQIAKQPRFQTSSEMTGDRRGDIMLLINGMPVIHIELKKNNVPISNAYYQIERYSKEGAFSGLFSLLQIFVAMNPTETVYFANPGCDGNFNKDYYFHWADFNNTPINNWDEVASTLLSIPMAHQLIGFYTIPDSSDGVLKVMRSYQYFASHAISDTVAKNNWDESNQLGGYVWHTTGSGKTMTSFKSAQLISQSGDADKVVFLVDRIELGIQSLKEYRGFAYENEDIQETINTRALISKLKSNEHKDSLIVTSIQKMSNIKSDEGGLNSHDIESMSSKKVVFIVDEAHRSTFGEMLMTIKDVFPKAIFFGFTGTPIVDTNQKSMNTTSTVFGDELHRYSITDGIWDKNVLGFDPVKVLIYKDSDVRKKVALRQCDAATEQEAIDDPVKREIYYAYMDKEKIKMHGEYDEKNKYTKGIEDYLPDGQYESLEYHMCVVEDILDNHNRLSRNGKFHAIFATSSIPECIKYYKLFKRLKPKFKITALFDPTIDNVGNYNEKEESLSEIISDYNARYQTKYTQVTHPQFKKDIALRLAHKECYRFIENDPNETIDLLLVVNQMLTGFDSKWINTLYLDKVIDYEQLIQAFSRTNRLFGVEKPFGNIRYYRRPHRMSQYIEKAVNTYSGNRPFGIFVDKLQLNIEKMNITFKEIEDIFQSAGVEYFESLPSEDSEKKKFAEEFSKLNRLLEASKIQGFRWDQPSDVIENNDSDQVSASAIFDENTYLILVQRYKELLTKKDRKPIKEMPFDLEIHITEIDTDLINADYMNTKFQKYIKCINDMNSLEKAKALEELHRTFSTLTQDEQKYANLFLRDVERGDIVVDANKSLHDYIADYQYDAKSTQIKGFALMFNIDEQKLKSLMNSAPTESNIDEFGRLDEIKSTIDTNAAREYFEKESGEKLKMAKINIKMDALLRRFILLGGVDVSMENNS